MVSDTFSHAMPATWISGNLIKFQKAWTVSWLNSAEPPQQHSEVWSRLMNALGSNRQGCS